MVDQDAKDVNEMVLEAKYGNWNKVFSILDRKTYLVNCIPEDRAWAALHQAAWWGDEEAVNNLLKYPACDWEVKTKQTLSGTEAGKNALWIAEELKPNPKIADILRKHTKEQRAKRFEDHCIPTFMSYKDGETMDKNGLPLLLLSLSNYKKTFHPAHVSVGQAFNDTMKEIFGYENAGTHWRDAKEKICFSIAAFDRSAAQELLEAKEEHDFFKSIVRLYTGNSVYREVNESLRREGLNQYKAKAEDLALGPYTLLLDVLLFYWGKLTHVHTPTYRRMTLSEKDLQQYQEGTRFVWLNFVSSSMNESPSFSGNVKFEIENDTPGAELWRPRDISKLSQYKSEAEALYPAGTEFEVMSKNNGQAVTCIKLKLRNPL